MARARPMRPSREIACRANGSTTDTTCGTLLTWASTRAVAARFARLSSRWPFGAASTMLAEATSSPDRGKLVARVSIACCDSLPGMENCEE